MRKQFILSLGVLFAFIALTLIGSAKIIEVPDAGARMNLMIVGGDVPAAGGGETVSFRSYASACNGNPSGDYVTVNVPAGVQTGDIMIGYAGGDNDENMVALAGWTQIDESTYDGTMTSGTYYRIVDGAEDASYNFSGGASHNDYMCGVIAAFSKSGGAFTVPTTANYHSLKGATATGITTDSTTVVSNDDILFTGWITDGAATVSEGPGGTQMGSLIQDNATLGLAAFYHDDVTTGAVTKTLTWSASDQHMATAIIIHAE